MLVLLNSKKLSRILPLVNYKKTNQNHILQLLIDNELVVVIPAGVPRKPGMTRDDLFKINAGIVRDLAVAAAKFAPKAFMCIISNPVNSTVPIVAEVFKQFNVYDPRRLVFLYCLLVCLFVCLFEIRIRL